MKTKEELNALKEEVETLNKKLAELREDELKQVTGGVSDFSSMFDGCNSIKTAPELPATNLGGSDYSGMH